MGEGSVFLLPKSVINDIEKLFKKFLWSCEESCKGRAKVAWSDVCKPKDQGGLGFKSLGLWNKTLLSKHLWNVAARKESLWVKWINVIKLKGRSVWDVSIQKDESWGWKSILELRGMMGKHMRYKIGNGITVNVWHDKWFSDEYIFKTISKKEIFYAGFSDNATVADLLDENGWKWPPNWVNKYMFLFNVPTPNLSNRPDMPVWVSSDGKEGAFSTNRMWKDVRGTDSKVCWYDLVWNSHCISRHTFVLWMAIKNKLSTQDKLARWYPNNTYCCSLCKKGVDSHDHLFFNYDYSKSFWAKVMGKAKMRMTTNNWNDTVMEMSKWKNKRSVWGIIKNLCVAAAVYYIWQERNKRIFGSSVRSVDDLFKVMIDDIRNRLVSITVKQSSAVQSAEEQWSVTFAKENA
ncbi:RNA-directed DNA polymerase, eukaryota, reverse transcriptase zinc-binding domain protein [Tanacetum coccineum]